MEGAGHPVDELCTTIRIELALDGSSRAAAGLDAGNVEPTGGQGREQCAGGRYRELTRRRVAFEAEAAGGLQALGLSPGCGYRLSLADV